MAADPPDDDPTPLGPVPVPPCHGALACGGAVLLVRRRADLITRSEVLTPDAADALAADLVAAARTARRLGGGAP
jgi:hypothetical protein